MKNKQLIPLVSAGAGVLLGTIGYMIARKKKQRMEGTGQAPHRKHSHIRKAKHAHEPDFTA